MFTSYQLFDKKRCRILCAFKIKKLSTSYFGKKNKIKPLFSVKQTYQEIENYIEILDLANRATLKV